MMGVAFAFQTTAIFVAEDGEAVLFYLMLLTVEGVAFRFVFVGMVELSRSLTEDRAEPLLPKDEKQLKQLKKALKILAKKKKKQQ
eukprot:CAMPEP_0202963494 /NCGR_PEP_ID=MMETSP1396-20130829/7495_1 /ASSEMBLY_ACC=CAM_ASM_000872 /TAXON_ID= /ORGANISM="Pseudokeronopsis sp., Strain Brazil" /LENGTH=84 /DNA_ID=CAMNT_0049684757 /DNA_START=178 /DNA_END=432 /DNA_ORIENTATION=-